MAPSTSTFGVIAWDYGLDGRMNVALFSPRNKWPKDQPRQRRALVRPNRRRVASSVGAGQMILFLGFLILLETIITVSLLALHQANVRNQREMCRLLHWLEWRLEHLEKEAMAKGDWWSGE